MRARFPLVLLALVSAAGVAYSGYLTYITYSTGQAACETFYYGLPSCFYGFVLYSMVFATALATLVVWKTSRAVAEVVLGASGVGFSAFLTGYVLSLNACVTLSVFGVPPCAMGLGMFALVLAIALSLLARPPDG